MSRKLKILFASSECTPFAKTGGLADVAGALPKALKSLGHDVRLIMPYYTAKIEAAKYGIHPVPGALDVPMGTGEGSHQLTAHLFECLLPNSEVPVYFINQHSFFDREELYRTDDGDYDDNANRFAFFSRAVLVACKHLDFQPDVVHCNDWHTGLVPAYMKTLYSHDTFFEKAASIFTIHNLAYQGLFPRDTLYMTGLPASSYRADGLEFYGQLNFMKAGLVFADLISTVSERYSKEIQTAEYGFGLEGVLQVRSKELYGIVNGIDVQDWSPEHDKYLPLTYDRNSPERKQEIKKVFLAEQGLAPEPEKALLGIISRLDNQKGFDLLAEIIDYVMNLPIQFVLLGTGDRRYHDLFEKIKAHYPEHAAVNLTFNNDLAHKIQAASDIFLMPSKFEPCGLNQLISLRYGTVPVVRYTGGLADTVQDFDSATGEGTGFVFHEYASMPFFNAIKKAVETYENKDAWRKLMQNGMAKDYSWTSSAQKYVDLYEKALALRPAE